MKAMTNQEVFDTVCAHLLKQRKRAAVGSFCKYRGLEGLMCAFGVLIPDEVYTDGMEGMDASVLIELNDFLSMFMPNKYLIITLQIIHDDKRNWRNLDTLKDKLRRCAKEFGLSADVLGEA